MKIVALLAVVAAAVTAAILLNLALLGYAQPRNDPVGKLSPRAVLTPAPLPAPRPVPRPAPAPAPVPAGEQDD